MNRLASVLTALGIVAATAIPASAHHYYSTFRLIVGFHDPLYSRSAKKALFSSQESPVLSLFDKKTNN